MQINISKLNGFSVFDPFTEIRETVSWEIVDWVIHFIKESILEQLFLQKPKASFVIYYKFHDSFSFGIN